MEQTSFQPAEHDNVCLVFTQILLDSNEKICTFSMNEHTSLYHHRYPRENVFLKNLAWVKQVKTRE